MSRSPLYERVESVLAGDIADGSLPPETQLPPEEGLIERFKVSRTTVRKAIQNLVERGLVEVRRGRGTFVTQPKITQELTELTGFVEDMQALGRTPTARLLDKRIVAADEVVAHHLALAPGTLVVRLQRVRLADGVASCRPGAPNAGRQPDLSDRAHVLYHGQSASRLREAALSRRSDPIRDAPCTTSTRRGANRRRLT